MGIIAKQSVASTLLTYLGVLIGFANFFYFFPAYMSPEQVGLVRTFQDGAMLMVPFIQLGVSQLTLKYYPAYKGQQYYSELISFIFIYFGLSTVFFSLLFWVFNQQVAAYFTQNAAAVVPYLAYMLSLGILLALYQLLVSLAQSLRNIVLPNFLKEVWLRFSTLAGILLFAMQLISFHQFMMFLIAAYFFNLIVLAGYLLKKQVFQFTFQFTFITKNRVKTMLSYALFTFLSASGILIIGKVDSLMVSGMLNLKSNAIYTTAFYIAVLIELPKRAVAQISLPVIASAFERNDMAEIRRVYQKSSLNNLLIGLLIFMGIWCNLDAMYSLIPNTQVYSMGKWVVLIIGLGKLLDMAAGTNGEIIVMSKYYRVNVYLVVLLTLFTVVANYLLIPWYGLEGAALGSSLALLLFNLSKYIFLVAKLNMQPFTRNTLKVLFIGIIAFFTGSWLPDLPSALLDIAFRSMAIIIVFGGLVWWLKPSEDVEALVQKILTFLRKGP